MDALDSLGDSRPALQGPNLEPGRFSRHATPGLCSRSTNRQAKNALNQLYRSKVEWHKKLALPVTIIIFFLIGAPLGAIVRRGGLGTADRNLGHLLRHLLHYQQFGRKDWPRRARGRHSTARGSRPSYWRPIAIYLTYKATNDSGLLDVDWYVVKFKKIKEKISGIFARFAHKNKK